MLEPPFFHVLILKKPSAISITPEPPPIISDFMLPALTVPGNELKGAEPCTLIRLSSTSHVRSHMDRRRETETARVVAGGRRRFGLAPTSRSSSQHAASSNESWQEAGIPQYAAVSKHLLGGGLSRVVTFSPGTLDVADGVRTTWGPRTRLDGAHEAAERHEEPVGDGEAEVVHLRGSRSGDLHGGSGAVGGGEHLLASTTRHAQSTPPARSSTEHHWLIGGPAFVERSRLTATKPRTASLTLGIHTGDTYRPAARSEDAPGVAHEREASARGW